MKHALLAFVLCSGAALALYPLLIGKLASAGVGQRVQGYNPRTHLVKAGTPTMGGLLFCVLTVAAWLILDRSREGFLCVFALGAGAGIGVLDDIANVTGRGALGLLMRQKLILQALVGICLGIGLDQSGLSQQVFPGLGNADLHWGIVPLTAVAVVATSNAVNLTDGVDGLAGTCSALVLAATWALAVHLGDRSAATLSAALLGGVLAFIVYNWWPARLFMGDTGSLALGCALAALAAELHLLWLMPLFGIVFVAETLSVVINVTAITRYQRRIFRASPLHHHFEELGLRERRLVLSFATAGAVGALLGAAAALKAGVGG